MAITCSVNWLSTSESQIVSKTPVELGAVGRTVTTIAAHPMTDALLLGTVDGEIVVWDPTHGCQTNLMQAHAGDVSCVSITLDGKYILSGSIDGSIVLWNRQLTQVVRFETESRIKGVSLSPDRGYIAAGGSDGSLRVWHTDSGEEICNLKAYDDEITGCAWVASNQVVTVDVKGHLVAWDIENKRTIRKLSAHEGTISQILVAPKSGWYVTASSDSTIRFWSTFHRERFSLPESRQPITGIDLTPDEKLLAAAYRDGMIRLYDVDRGKLYDEFAAHESRLVGCALLTGSRDLITVDQEGCLRGWDLGEMGMTRFVNQHGGEVYRVQYTPDNIHLLSVGEDGHLKLWDRNELVETGYIDSHDQPITSCAVSPDNRLWALGTADGVIKIWDVELESFEVTIRAHEEMVSDLKFLPDGDWLISSSWDMKLKLWNLQTKQKHCVYSGHTKAVAACDISLDARHLVSVAWDGQLRVWDLNERLRETLNERLLLEGHDDRVLCCTISPDGSIVATGSADRTIRLWRTDRVTEPSVLVGHTDQVTCCRFTPDGQLLISADRDGVVYVWEPTMKQAIGSISHTSAILTLDVAPDGAQVAVGDEEGLVHFIELSYEFGPNWIAGRTQFKAQKMWRRGSAPEEVIEVICLYCGHAEVIKKKGLGLPWKCGKCSLTMMVCPNPLPPLPKE
ncbi:WD domain, G-beta repeat [Planctomycetes bacterium Pan216]|uniref:WD domain, G-beta repeat n=1 Tax=Kolteria novifilia TaxID=2527975 RepID=A0A518B8X8_9BACT|nr:WD domain, G-beta repeat [Planctomycetes bacterium Pan216]